MVPNAERPVLEHLLLASCLENAPYEKADEAYAALVHTFFDWNEIRVTTVKELAETMTGLPDPGAAAQRVKRVLQAVFETTYAFDLEDLRKKNLGVAIERLEKLGGSDEIQRGLRGADGPGRALHPRRFRHPGRPGACWAWSAPRTCSKGVVPGLERAIPKNKGVEFGTMLHQLGADFTANPYSTNPPQDSWCKLEPDAETRLPKRRPKEPKPEPAPVAAPAPAAVDDADKSKPKKKKKPDEPAPTVEPAKTPAAKGPAVEAKAAEKAAPKPAVEEKAPPANPKKPAKRNPP